MRSANSTSVPCRPPTPTHLYWSRSRSKSRTSSPEWTGFPFRARGEPPESRPTSGEARRRSNGFARARSRPRGTARATTSSRPRPTRPWLRARAGRSTASHSWSSTGSSEIQLGRPYRRVELILDLTPSSNITLGLKWRYQVLGFTIEL